MIAVRGATKSCPVKCEQQSPGAAKTRSHTSNIVPAWLAERIWCTQFQSSLLNIYFRPSGFQLSLLLIYFRYGLNTRSYCTKEWHRTYPICDYPLSWSVRRSFATLQKSRCYNRSLCEKTPYPIWFSWRRESYPLLCEQRLKHPEFRQFSFLRPVG